MKQFKTMANPLRPGHRVTVAVVALLVAAPAVAPADVSLPGSAAPLEPDRIFKSPLGSWAEYEVAGLGSSMSIRFALVKKVAQGFTLEMSFELPLLGKQPPPGSRTTYQTDYALDGKEWKVVGMRQKSGNAPVQRMPLDKAKTPTLPTPVPGPEEEITTAAGTFRCRRYLQSDQTLWIAPSLPLLGLVKMSMNKQMQVTMTLRAQGGDARPSFE
jgi:hypothetical protein